MSERPGQDDAPATNPNIPKPIAGSLPPLDEAASYYKENGEVPRDWRGNPEPVPARGDWPRIPGRAPVPGDLSGPPTDPNGAPLPLYHPDYRGPGARHEANSGSDTDVLPEIFHPAPPDSADPEPKAYSRREERHRIRAAEKLEEQEKAAMLQEARDSVKNLKPPTVRRVARVNVEEPMVPQPSRPRQPQDVIPKTIQLVDQKNAVTHVNEKRPVGDHVRARAKHYAKRAWAAAKRTADRFRT